eukprot:Sspe_Gene.104309::Locus_80359_Transcript_1_1_Confidence_1.000_Length_972::g.104309::m.104309
MRHFECVMDLHLVRGKDALRQLYIEHVLGALEFVTSAMHSTAVWHMHEVVKVARAVACGEPCETPLVGVARELEGLQGTTRGACRTERDEEVLEVVIGLRQAYDPSPDPSPHDDPTRAVVFHVHRLVDFFVRKVAALQHKCGALMTDREKDDVSTASVEDAMECTTTMALHSLRMELHEVYQKLEAMYKSNRKLEVDLLHTKAQCGEYASQHSAFEVQTSQAIVDLEAFLAYLTHAKEKNRSESDDERAKLKYSCDEAISAAVAHVRPFSGVFR